MDYLKILLKCRSDSGGLGQGLVITDSKVMPMMLVQIPHLLGCRALVSKSDHKTIHLDQEEKILKFLFTIFYLPKMPLITIF